MKRILIILSFFVSVCHGQNVGTRMQSNFPSSTEVALSRVGIISDASLAMYSSTFGTNQTAAIQAILDRATSTAPLTVYWDVKVSVTGLRIKSNTTIYASAGCGAILRDDADDHLLKNYNWTANNNAIVDSNIYLVGGIWNGNGFRGGAAQQIHSQATKGMTAGFNFYGVKNLTLRDFEIRNTRTYAGFFTTTENLLIDNFKVDQGPNVFVNQDGFDLVGMLKGATISNGTMTTADDRLAFGSDALGGGTAEIGGDLTVNTGVQGIQESVTISHIHFIGEGKGLRFNSSVSLMTDFNISDIFGTCRTSVIYLESENNIAQIEGYEVVEGEGNFKNFTFSNINVSADSLYSYDYVPDHHGFVQIGGTAENIVFKNFTRNNMRLPYPTFAIHKNYGAPVINGLRIDGYNSSETGTTYTGDHIRFEADVTVSGFELLNTRVKANGDNNTTIINIMTDADVGDVSLYNVTGRNINTLVKHSSFATRWKAVGVTHHGYGGASFVTTATVTDLNVSNYSGEDVDEGTFTTKRGDAFGVSGGGGSEGGEAGSGFPFLASFLGTAATALSSYTPEEGTIGTITGSPVLDGSGHLTMPASSTFLTTSFTQSGFGARLDISTISDGADLYFLALTAGSHNAYIHVSRTGSDLSIQPLVDDVGTEGPTTVAVSNFAGLLIVRDPSNNTLSFYYKNALGNYSVLDSMTDPGHTYTNIKVNNVAGATVTVDLLRITDL